MPDDPIIGTEFGERAWKILQGHSNVQIARNNQGHIVIRFYCGKRVLAFTLNEIWFEDLVEEYRWDQRI